MNIPELQQKSQLGSAARVTSTTLSFCWPRQLGGSLGDRENDPFTDCPNMDENRGFGGNVKQKFTWTGPIPAACGLQGRK